MEVKFSKTNFSKAINYGKKIKWYGWVAIIVSVIVFLTLSGLGKNKPIKYTNPYQIDWKTTIIPAVILIIVLILLIRRL